MSKKNYAKLQKNDIISFEDFIKSNFNGNIREMYENVMKDKILEQYTFPKKPSSDGYYHIYVKDQTREKGNRQIKCKTLDGLKEKVYKIETAKLDSKRRTFKEVFEALCEDKLQLSFNERKYSTLNTIRNNKLDYKRYIENTNIEKMYIDEISDQDIDKCIIFNAKRYTLLESSFKRLICLFSSVFKFAVQKKLIIQNPWNQINLKRYQKVYNPPIPIEERAHSNKEIDQIVNYLHDSQKKKPTYFAAFALELQIMMGCRRGEIPPLRWSDLKNNEISICREQITVKKSDKIDKEFDKIVEHTKTDAIRRFPITAEMDNLFHELKSIHEENNIKSEFLFPADTPEGCIRNQRIYHCYKQACKKLGIILCKNSIKGTHSFRRNKITDIINSNKIGSMETAWAFGNSTKTIEKNYYLGCDLNQLRKVLENRSYGRVTKKDIG